MGIQIKLPNANFNNYISMIEYPIKDELKGLFYLGGNNSLSTLNHSNSSVATAFGTIDYAQDYATFNEAFNAKYIQTNIKDSTNDFTVVSLTRKPVTGEARSIVSSYGSLKGFDATNASMLTTNGSNYPSTNSGVGTGVAQVFSLVAYTVSGQVAKGYNLSNGEVTLFETDQLGFNRVLGVNDLKIGGSATSMSNSGTLDIAFVSYHAKALSHEELRMVYDYLKIYYSKKTLPMK